MRQLRQRADLHRHEERGEARKSEVFAPRRAYNCVEADVTRLIDECLARVTPFEYCPEAELGVDELRPADEEGDLLADHVAMLEDELQYFAIQSESAETQPPSA